MVFDRSGALRRRHLRVRRKVHGTAERPRLCIHKSLRHLYAQLIDDDGQQTLLFVTTNQKANRNGKTKSFRNTEWARRLGGEIAQKATAEGIKAVVFDRGGYQYHGCVKEFADAARKGGLEF